MEISELIPHIESLVFASDKPLAPAEITELVNNAFGFMEEKVSVEQIDAAIEGIVEKYSSEFYPFEVAQSGGGWQFLTKKEFHKTVAQLNGEKFLKRLSTAALETLAIIAYKHPVTKGEIEAIRGVSSDYAVQKLLEKELIIITGRNEKMPGHPLVYATSKSFMDYFGINSADDLPKIKEVLAGQLIQPTVINHTDFEQSEVLAVTDDGELISAKALGSDEAAELIDDSNTDKAAEEATTPDDDNAGETIEDEIAEEEYISDEIFVAEDDLIEERQVEETLLEEEKKAGDNPGTTEDDSSNGDEREKQ